MIRSFGGIVVSIAAFQDVDVDPGSIPGRRNVFPYQHLICFNWNLTIDNSGAQNSYYRLINDNDAFGSKTTGSLQVIGTVWIGNITQLGKVIVTLRRLENCIHQSKLQESIEGPMENAVGFLIIPPPRWWGEAQRWVTLSPVSPPPLPTVPCPRADPGGESGGGGSTSGSRGWGS